VSFPLTSLSFPRRRESIFSFFVIGSDRTERGDLNHLPNEIAASFPHNDEFSITVGRNPCGFDITRMA